MTGARIHEVRTMEILEDAIRIKGKGGKIRVLDFSYRLDELEEIKNLMARLEELSQGIDWQQYCQSRGGAYQRHVKAACRSLGDEYGGAHGFRANYAQGLRKKLERKDLTSSIGLTTKRCWSFAFIRSNCATKGFQNRYSTISRNGKIDIAPSWISRSILTETARAL